MTETTVTVGDTEVEIRETEDGFEAVEAPRGTSVYDSGLYLRADSADGSFGCVVPLDADFDISQMRDGAANEWTVLWHDEDNMSSMSSWKHREPDSEYDRGAHVSNVEIVRR